MNDLTLKVAKLIRLFASYIFARKGDDAVKLYSGLSNEEKKEFSKLFKAIIIFTGASVDTVRDPSLFNPDKAEDMINKAGMNVVFKNLTQLGILEDPWIPTQEDYTYASQVLRFLATQEGLYAPGILYRGIIELPANVFLDLTKPGSEFSIGEIASTSHDANEADTFATGDPYRIRYILENPNLKGFNVDKASIFYHEKEVILGGKVRVDGITWYSRLTGKRTKERDWDVLVKEVEQAENRGQPNRVSLVTVYATIL